MRSSPRCGERRAAERSSSIGSRMTSRARRWRPTRFAASPTRRSRRLSAGRRSSAPEARAGPTPSSSRGATYSSGLNARGTSSQPCADSAPHRARHPAHPAAGCRASRWERRCAVAGYAPPRPASRPGGESCLLAAGSSSRREPCGRRYWEKIHSSLLADITHRSDPDISRPPRISGYAAIREYAAIGDGRTVALVARDGSIDWLCLPDLDSARGGRFVLEPELPFQASRRYLPGTNVLETTFSTSAGRVRLTDAMTLPAGELSPYRELVRRVEGLAGMVPLHWRVEPRFGYGTGKTRIERRAGAPVALGGRDALALCSWEAGEPTHDAQAITGRFSVGQGGSSLLALSGAHQEPLVLPTRADAEVRLHATVRSWREWAQAREYSGPWREAVIRSALVLKLLVYAPSGAIAAAPTTSLPEEIGGERNWDYRFSWPRDAAFTLQALLALGCAPEARAFFSWILHASRLTHPRLQVLYRLDGRAEADEQSLPLAGYRGSRPVRVGNGAADQMQLDVYGELLQAASHFASSTGGL